MLITLLFILFSLYAGFQIAQVMWDNKRKAIILFVMWCATYSAYLLFVLGVAPAGRT